MAEVKDMGEPMTFTCKVCDCSVALPAYYECRLEPPTVNTNAEEILPDSWPIVDGDHWCAVGRDRWERKKAEMPADYNHEKGRQEWLAEVARNYHKDIAMKGDGE